MTQAEIVTPKLSPSQPLSLDLQPRPLETLKSAIDVPAVAL